MKVLGSERQELIDALVAETAMGGITASLLETGIHLTDALRVLFAQPLDGMSLVFCGGSRIAHNAPEQNAAVRPSARANQKSPPLPQE